MTIDEIKKWMLESSGFPVTQANAEYLERFQAIAFHAGATSRDAEVAQLRELLNCYNLGGWTDSARLIKERDQLRAQINKLREALSSAESALDESRDYPVTYDEVITALITTPEQSLAEYRNKVIEECAKQCEAPNEYGFHRTCDESAEAIRTLKEQS